MSKTLETKRLFLRAFESNDLGNVFKGLSDPDVIKYYGVSFNSLEATKAQMEWFENLEKTGTGLWRAITLKNDVFVGAIGLNNLTQEHRKAEIGFWLLPKFWGNGYLSEAFPEVINDAFGRLNLHRIEAFVEIGNSNSKRVLEKFQFEFEGTMKDCEIKNGNFISISTYARIRMDNSNVKL